ncbi:polyubiquitin-like protein [Arabidopsis thaliana]|jgi:E3 ubiquitin-protein ligase NEDD4|uniref:E3 ubiquitin-protein ligase UPL5 n=1 Tax=Arabidopsis thaliana TaxID=3702 RepID=UPL5_ARATH|nr:ubiquitin protein ligase 5 [Arabidopsis thaliana]Q9SU29.1 RecName: Full=E3 ubiquitin-protein ligase UPL5; Short=Ubiquitin-protein ligase 5; AltName: Full=HECT-type E3 ubiquitin transferase UPL5 [Arabidopsis thaliana]AEE83149.1 ubiquitin protein ligase 5 [Arabidopsis thaliana]CAB41727.2 polyubiquitin-like protein [Arabidopsis thaliana]CAB78300.1 polyubiquitin-like protein [Arabidopsis thaliana]BAF01094.1 polyubiquitin-like protein [Arabidopsis thaliana]|eukprot:NP_192994.1 ubiquitin protein ligase 5 [Arabidopsis thaliana]
MTLSRSSADDSTNNANRSYSAVAGTDNKRKRDEDSSDYVGVAESLEMLKKQEIDADHMAASAQQTLISWRSGENSRSLSSSGECSSSNRPESTRLQIFVRMMSGGKTIVIHAEKYDTVEKLHQRIEWKTKIPALEQRVIYKGKQLQRENSLTYYSIEQDASLQLVARMQSTEHPVAWQTIDDIMYTISRMYKGENLQSNINEKIVTFFAMIPVESDESIAKYLNIFSNSSVPAALVMLYASSLERNKSCAKSSVKLFLSNCVALPKNQKNYCLPIVLEFCKLLRKVCPDQKLYVTCRNTLGSMLETFDNPHGVYNDQYETFGVEIFPFFTELTGLLLNELAQNSGPSFCDFQKVSSFWQQLRKVIELKVAFPIPIVLPMQSTALEAEIRHLHRLFGSLLTTMDLCMCRVESSLADKEVGNSETMSSSWSQYLSILKIINSMSNIYQGAKGQLAVMLNKNKVSFSALVVKFAKRGDDHQWIFEYKEATNFEARRHLAMLLFPDVKEDFEEMHEMLIDRSNLLSESFEYIVGASPEALHGGLFMEFKNEEATGPGVLREWFYLVCQEIFNPKNTLFLRSADDFRRFSPNPASKVDPLHPDFFEFTGRVIALALMHKVQVGVLFDRVFFLQLAGLKISLEDIKDTDRIMYNSCKQILEMDPEFFDSNAGLGLTFVLETEELGKRDTIELCPDGKLKAVNSKNRKQYVDLLIERRFATPILEQVKQFSRGFTDMLSHSVPPRSFFKRLYLEDLDGMLRGGENPISIDDWKAHTEYNGFKETDRQIDWFWKILKKMTEEEQRSILFFWTSNKFVPVEGFRGLSSKLYIYRLYEANDRLPLSHTCFYRLCIPRYPTITLMEQRLRLIAQDHVSSSFGKW